MTATRALLARHGLHCTAQRAALYEALSATATHPTAEELHQTVRSRVESLSLATVYSALETFCRVGLARKVPTMEGCCRYDSTMADHVHLRDVESGRIRDVPADLGSRLLENVPAHVLEEIERRFGVRIEGVDIHLLAASAARANGAQPTSRSA